MQKQKVSIMPLGAGCQVGRSCLILSINNKKIMLDCGLMINKGGRDALPLLSKVNAEQLSMVIITHAHLDHCGALPYFLANFNYKKKVYMTKPTKDIYYYLVKDTLKVRNEEALFNMQEVFDSLSRVEPVDFGVSLEEQGIKITPYIAGHIVGAAMFIIEVDGVKVLYTGDYSCEEDRYIMKAEIPPTNVDILISQSTFGTRIHESRHIRQQKFQEQVRKIVKGGGKCLLPVFSAGRAQQLLFILDEYWQSRSEQLGNIHIYYTVSLIQNCKNIYETYIDMLSKKIKERFYKEVNNPFIYRYIHYLRQKNRLKNQDHNPMVVMCTPGMLQSGQSRTLLQQWCHDPKNGVIITGYCAENSIASQLKKGGSIESMDGTRTINVNLNVSEVSFAAHADCLQTTQFINKVQPRHVVLVHGSGKNAQNLRTYLQQHFKDLQSVSCPKNEQELQFHIEITQTYNITGSLKDKIESMLREPSGEAQFTGYIVATGDTKVLVEEQDKDKYFPHLQGNKVKQIIHVDYCGGLTLAQLLAYRIFKDARIEIINNRQVLVIKGCIFMSIQVAGKSAIVEFISSVRNDIIADQFCYLLNNILYDPLLQKNIQTEAKQDNQETNTLIFDTILQQYPQSTHHESIITVRLKGQNIGMVDLRNGKVEAGDEYLKIRLIGLLGKFQEVEDYYYTIHEEIDQESYATKQDAKLEDKGGEAQIKQNKMEAEINLQHKDTNEVKKQNMMIQ